MSNLKAWSEIFLDKTLDEECLSFIKVAFGVSPKGVIEDQQCDLDKVMSREWVLRTIKMIFFSRWQSSDSQRSGIRAIP